MKFFKIDLLVITGLLFFLPLFFYHLGSYSLADFDEAWYAEIARNIIRNKEPVLLSFNGLPYNDHPPLGFNLIALSFLVFGVNEFAARLPSSILGFLSLILVYLIGKNLFNKVVGVSATLITLSCVWFIFRARSGNLDNIFLFFYLLTFYFAVKIKNDTRWILAFFSSLGLVLLTKSVIGITILIPSLIFLITEKVKIPLKKTVLGILLFIFILSPWFLAHFLESGPGFFFNLYLFATRSASKTAFTLGHIFSSQTFLYLHNGIGKWYYPFLVSFSLSIFFIPKQKKLLLIYAITFFLLYYFLTNAKTEIWHLIPLYPFIGLIVAFFVYQVTYYLFKNKGFILLFFLGISAFQIYSFRNNIRLTDKGDSDLAYVSRAAKNSDGQLYLDGHDLLPSAVFYAEKNVDLVRFQKPSANSLKGMMEYGDKPFLLLTEQWRLTTDQIDPTKYEVIAQKNGYLLIRVIR